ncbi:PulJ/GspJ family protein [Effusibacillus dendaii]|uniref:Prepilin-type N-terminal cleavage/methylation domain-containing protein n=1 Tax=Effusibacillus dendaii TaxID=2743772 RepID=A0A7I8D7L0_9BACL|nr:prepilin-type N-terminal cleavage/methylation domain-containing protein [Effusibacillus dendaii]BCJ85997.1 hypothetical protein skT53_09820 [Effusibacillus dendaii]
MTFLANQSSRSGNSDQRGMTLVEILIGMFVLSVVLLVITGWMGVWQKTASAIGSGVQTRLQAETAVRLIEEDFRRAERVIESGDELVFVDLRQDQIRYRLSNNGNLLRSVNNKGSSVIAAGVNKWRTEQIGSLAVKIAIGLQGSDRESEQEAIIAARRW